MSVHLTIPEIEARTGLLAEDIRRICVAESVPVIDGRIDVTLLEAVVAAQREERGTG